MQAISAGIFSRILLAVSTPRIPVMHWLCCLALLVWLLTPCLVIAQSPRVRVLMVAIDEYQNAGRINGFRNLKGAENDLELVRASITRRLNIAEMEVKTVVKTLKNAEATRSRILSTFRTHLVDGTQQGDLIIFFFAGHGGRLYSSGSTEPDRYDETLVTHDAFDTQGRIFGIRDKEIAQLLKEITAKGVNPIVIIDACHAAGATKMLIDGNARAAPPIRIPQQDLTQSSEATRTVATKDYILLAATNAKDPAYETNRFGKPYGEFSVALAAAIRNLPVESTYPDVIRHVQQRLDMAGLGQVAAASGPLDRQLFSNKDLTYLAIEALRLQENVYEIDAGRLAGVSKGSKFDLFQSAFDASSRSNLLATGEVVDVRLESADVRFPPSAHLPARGFVSERERQFGDFRLNVRVRGTSSTSRKVREALQYNGRVNIVQDDSAKLWLDSHDSKVQLLRSDGSEIVPAIDVSQADWISKLTEKVKEIAQYHAVLSIYKAQPQKYVEAEILLEGDGVGRRKLPPLKNGEAQLKPGDRILVRVRNRHPSKELYVNVITLAPDYSIDSMYPRNEEPEKLLIGGAFETCVFPLEEPYGKDIVIVYATDAKISLAPLIQKGVRDIRDIPDHPLAVLIDAAKNGARSASLRARVTEWEVQFLTSMTKP